MNEHSRPMAGDGQSARSVESTRLAEICCTVVGIGGSLLCSFGMVAAGVGLFAAAGATAARGSSMAGMGTASGLGHTPGWLHAIVRFGPQILVASLILVAIGVALRRRQAVVPVIAGGTILYVGMYGQASLIWMYLAIAVGTALLIGAYLTALRWRPGRTRPPVPEASTALRDSPPSPRPENRKT